MSPHSAHFKIAHGCIETVQVLLCHLVSSTALWKIIEHGQTLVFDKIPNGIIFPFPERKGVGIDL